MVVQRGRGTERLCDPEPWGRNEYESCWCVWPMVVLWFRRSPAHLKAQLNSNEFMVAPGLAVATHSSLVSGSLYAAYRSSVLYSSPFFGVRSFPYYRPSKGVVSANAILPHKIGIRLIVRLIGVVHP